MTPPVDKAPTPTWPPTCGQCKFYDGLGGNSFCRFDPPNIVYGFTPAPPSQAAYWPSVNAQTDWCGQFIVKG